MEKADSKKKLKDFLEQMYGHSVGDDELNEYKKKIVRIFALLIEVDKRVKKIK